MRVKLTSDYVCGVIAGTGFGLVVSSLIVTWLAMDLKQLALPGVIVACAGGFFAYLMQQRAARLKSAVR